MEDDMPKNTVHEGATYGAHEADVVASDDPAIADMVAARQDGTVLLENQRLRDQLREVERQRDNALAALRNARHDAAARDGAEVDPNDRADERAAADGNKLLDETDAKTNDTQATAQTSKSTPTKAKG